MPTQKFERIDVSSHLQGTVMVLHPLRVTQISEGGVRIETSAPLHLDSLHEFRLNLETATVVLKGRIVHCRLAELEDGHITYVAGVEFVEPPEHAIVALRSYVGRLKARATTD